MVGNLRGIGRRFYAALLSAILVACGVATPTPQSLMRRSTPLANDLDCGAYHVDDSTEEGHSSHLGCTGLYRLWSERELAEDARPFTPAYSLWSDGAEKARWISLPPGEHIDSGGEGYLGSMDGWIFPIGTKAWKQFSFGSRRIETRMLWKRREGWFQTTYVWSSDQSVAVENDSSTGLLVEGLDPDGPPYEVPSPRVCERCHSGAEDTLLGFEAINLGAPSAQGLTLSQLASEGLLTQNPDRDYQIPGDADASSALGWLHSNCGAACHNSRAMPGGLVPYMRLQISDLSTVEETQTWRTAVGQPAHYYPLTSSCSDVSTWRRIVPGDPDCSAISYRDAVRNPIGSPLVDQMPPLLSHRVPVDEVATLRRWISSLKHATGERIAPQEPEDDREGTGGQ